MLSRTKGRVNFTSSWKAFPQNPVRFGMSYWNFLTNSYDHFLHHNLIFQNCEYPVFTRLNFNAWYHNAQKSTWHPLKDNSLTEWNVYNQPPPKPRSINSFTSLLCRREQNLFMCLLLSCTDWIPVELVSICHANEYGIAVWKSEMKTTRIYLSKLPFCQHKHLDYRHSRC